MAVYPTWKIRYGIGIESAGWGTGVAAGTKIPTNGPKGIWMNNLNINFDSGQEFADAIQDGVYDKWMYTIFDPPIKYPEQVLTLDEDPYFFRADPKLNGLVSGDVPPTAFHAKNEGMGAERGREVNGFDESWIGHCYDDSDMGLRLSRAGAVWMLLDPVATVEIVNPRHYFPHLVWRSTPEASLPRFLACEHDVSRIVSGNAGQLVGQKPEWAWYA